MSSSSFSSHFYTVSASSIVLYGLQGFHSNGHWAIGFNFDGTYVPVETSPSPVSEEILQVIASDAAVGREHLIHTIQMTNRVAVRLFLEGILTFQHFRNAFEQEQGILVPAVFLGEKQYMLCIEPETSAHYSFSTRDASGELV